MITEERYIFKPDQRIYNFIFLHSIMMQTVIKIRLP